MRSGYLVEGWLPTDQVASHAADGVSFAIAQYLTKLFLSNGLIARVIAPHSAGPNELTWFRGQGAFEKLA